MIRPPSLKNSACLAATLLMFGGVMAAQASDYQTTVLGQGPAGYWRLNETTLPLPYTIYATNSGSLGATVLGTYTNNPSRGQTGPFTGSQAMGLDGLNQFVTTPWQAAINPATFTFEIWANPAQVPYFAYVAGNLQTGNPRAGWYMAQDNNSTFQVGNGFVVRFFATNGTAQSITLFATNDLPLGSWYHLVLTFDGTTATLYKNGVVAQSGIPTGAKFVPNGSGPNGGLPFNLGCRSDGGFPWPGQLAEAAYYGTALTGTQVANHYNLATSSPGTYASTVVSDGAIMYYRFREPPAPVAANLGSLGAAGNGLYIFNATPNRPGPRPATYGGLNATNTCVSFDAPGNLAGGSVSLKALNLNTNTVTISGWLNATGAQALATGLIFSRAGSTVAGLNIDAAYGGLNLGYTWNNDPNTYNWSPSSLLGFPALPDSDWAWVALVVRPDYAAIYMCDRNNFANFSGATNMIAHPNQAFNGSTLIGADGGFNNRFFNGAVDEVAIFKRSLTEGELYTQYASAVGNVPPRVFVDPQVPIDPLYAGDPLTLVVDAGGTPDQLAYQWRKATVAISGASSSAYTIPVLSTGDSGSYDCVVTNLYGQVTSGSATITVNPAAAPTITLQPVGRTLYPGGTLHLTVGATGGGLQYQWSKGGSPIANATNNAYTVASVTTADGGSYSVSVTNALGQASGGPAVVTVPSVAAGSLEAAIVGDGAESWWRLDESSGTVMFDGLGRHDGYYTNTFTLASPGVTKTTPALGVASDGTSAYYGYVPYSSALGSAAFTLECWAKVPDASANYCPVSFYDGGNKGGEFYYSDVGSGTWRGAIGAGTDPYLFYYLGDTPGAEIVPGKWMHLVVAYSSTLGLRCYVNGVWGGNAYGNFTRNLLNGLWIGGVGGAINYKMKGTVDEVAFYTKALTAAQVQAHYVAGLFGGTTAPFITIQPVSTTVPVGGNASFNGFADGSTPITYQWYKDGSAIAGATTTILSLNSVYYTAVGSYTLQASNPVSTVMSSAAMLNVAPIAAYANVTNGLVLHLRFDGDYTDSSGRGNNATAVGAPSIVTGKIGSGALHYNTDTTLAIYNYLTLGARPDFLFSSNVDFSVAYWVRTAAGATNGDLPFLCSATNSTFGPGLTFAPSYKLGGWAWSLNGLGVYGADNSINNGQWHHVVSSFTRNGQGVTWLDGVQVDSRLINSAGDVDTGGPLNIGQDPTGLYGETGAADLDDMGIWRRALTGGEAYAIYYVGANMGKSFDSYGPWLVNLTQAPNGKLIVTWQGGTLVSSGTIVGPWAPVAGATPPNYVLTPATTNQFFKVQP